MHVCTQMYVSLRTYIYVARLHVLVMWTVILSCVRIKREMN